MRINEQGRLYGASFIDYQNKTILNGSRLGKEFSANALHELFTCKSAIEISQSTNSFQYEQVDNNIDFLLGLSLFEQHGEDSENERFLKRKVLEVRRKRRRKS